MSDDQISRLDEDNVKTEPSVEEITSHSEPQLQNSDVGPSYQDEASAAISAAEHQQPEPPEPSQTSTRNRKQPDRFGEPIPANLLKNGGWMWWFQTNIKKLRSIIKDSENEKRLAWQTLSMINGHWMKLKSNSVLALSLSYWPINHMWEVNFPTNRNQILTSIDLQLMNSIVPNPYMILVKCWWKLEITSGIRN